MVLIGGFRHRLGTFRTCGDTLHVCCSIATRLGWQAMVLGAWVEDILRVKSSQELLSMRPRLVL